MCPKVRFASRPMNRGLRVGHWGDDGAPLFSISGSSREETSDLGVVDRDRSGRSRLGSISLRTMIRQLSIRSNLLRMWFKAGLKLADCHFSFALIVSVPQMLIPEKRLVEDAVEFSVVFFMMHYTINKQVFNDIS